MKFRVGDKVVVITGANKGKIGKIIRILSKESRVIVEGINLVKKHQKPNTQNQTGGIIEFEAPIHSSNVMLVDPKTGKGTRKKLTKEEKKESKTAKEVKKTEQKKETIKKTATKKEAIKKAEPKKTTKKETTSKITSKKEVK